MKKSIYDVYVTVTSQEQADRLKGVCLEYGLPIWDSEIAFEILDKNEVFGVSVDSSDFFIIDGSNKENKTKVTKSEFIELAKKFKQ